MGLKVVVSGGRNINDYHLVSEAITNSGFIIDEIVSGNAKGVDLLGERWGKECDKPIKKFPANWGEYGRSAGARRNAEMANYADALIAVWDGKSKGTKNMIDNANKKGLLVYIENV